MSFSLSLVSFKRNLISSPIMSSSRWPQHPKNPSGSLQISFNIFNVYRNISVFSSDSKKSSSTSARQHTQSMNWTKAENGLKCGGGGDDGSERASTASKAHRALSTIISSRSRNSETVQRQNGTSASTTPAHLTNESNSWTVLSAAAVVVRRCSLSTAAAAAIATARQHFNTSKTVSWTARP